MEKQKQNQEPNSQNSKKSIERSVNSSVQFINVLGDVENVTRAKILQLTGLESKLQKLKEEQRILINHLSVSQVPICHPTIIPSSFLATQYPTPISTKVQDFTSSILPHSSKSNLKMEIDSLCRKSRTKDEVISVLKEELKLRNRKEILTKEMQQNPFITKDIQDFNTLQLLDLFIKPQPPSDRLIPSTYSQDRGHNYGLRVIYRVDSRRLLLGWDPPRVSGITGYEIYADGVLLQRVQSGTRSHALLENLNLNKRLVLTMYALTSHGRIPEPEVIVYNGENEERRRQSRQAHSTPHAEAVSLPNQVLGVRKKEAPYFQEYFVGYNVDDDLPPTIEDAISKVGPAAEAIKNLFIEQNHEIRNLTQQRESLLEEISQLQERANRKSVDITEIKVDMKRILSDHKKFQDTLNIPSTTTEGAASSATDEQASPNQDVGESPATDDNEISPTQEIEVTAPPGNTEIAPSEDVEEYYESEVSPVQNVQESAPAGDSKVASEFEEAENIVEEIICDTLTESIVEGEHVIDVIDETKQPEQDTEFSDVAEAIMKAGSIIKIIKKLVVGQDFEIKTLLSERKKMLQVLSNLQMRANKRSIDMSELTKDIKQLMSDHKQFQNILNASRSGNVVGEESTSGPEPPAAEELIAKMSLDKEDVKKSEKDVIEEQSTVEQDIEKQPSPEENYEEQDTLKQQTETQPVEELTEEQPTVEEQDNEVPVPEQIEETQAEEQFSEQKEVPQAIETDLGEESEDAYESTQEMTEDTEPVTTETQEETQPTQEEQTLESESSEEVTDLSRRVAEALKNAGSVIKVITILVAEQDMEIRDLLKEKKKQLKDIKCLQDRADRKSLDVKDLNDKMQQLMSDHKRFQDILNATSSTMKPLEVESAAQPPQTAVPEEGVDTEAADETLQTVTALETEAESEQVTEPEPVAETEPIRETELSEDTEPVEEMTLEGETQVAEETEPAAEIELVEETEPATEIEPAEMKSATEMETAEMKQVEDMEPAAEIELVEETEPATEIEPAEMKSATEMETAEMKPVEDMEPAAEIELVEETEPATEIEPAEMKSATEMQTAEMKPVEDMEPAAEIELVEETEPATKIEPAEMKSATEMEIAEMKPVEDMEPAAEIELVEETEPATEIEPAEMKSATEMETAEMKPVGDMEPAAEIELVEKTEPATEIEPAEMKSATEMETAEMKPVEDMEPAEGTEPAAEMETAEETEPAAEVQPEEVKPEREQAPLEESETVQQQVSAQAEESTQKECEEKSSQLADQDSNMVQEVMMKADSVIEIIKKLVIKQDLEIKRLLNEREQQLATLNNLQERAKNKSAEVIHIQIEISKLMSEHTRFQKILNVSEGGMAVSQGAKEAPTEMVGPKIQKENTILRNAIPAHLKLQMVLQFGDDAPSEIPGSSSDMEGEELQLQPVDSCQTSREQQEKKLEKRVLSSASDLHELAQCAAEITKHYIPSAGRLFISVPTRQDISNFKIKQTSRTKRSTQSSYSNCSDQTLTVGKKQYLAVPRYLFSIYDYWFNNMLCRLHDKVRITSFNHILNTIIKYIHSIQLWTLIVDDLTNDCIYIYEKFDGFIFILQADELQNIKMNTKLLSNLSLNRAKVIVIIDGIAPQMHIVFQFLDDYSLREAVVLHKDKNECFKVLSWIPDKCGDLKKVNILGICKHTKYIPRKLKTRNMNLNKKCYFQLLGIHAPPFSIANEEEMVLDGIELKLLQLIVSHLNLELIYDNTHKTTKEFGLGYRVGEDTYVNSVTFMERYYTQRYTWFMLRTESHPHWSSVARVFKLSTWVCVLLSLILISTTHKFLDFFSSADTVRYFLTSLAVFLNVSVMEKPQIARLRAVFFSWVMFSIAFTTVFQAFMTSFFTEPGRQHQIDTYEELEKSGMHVCILHRYPVEFSYILESFRSEFLVFQNDCGMLKYCFHNPNVACFTSEETFLYNSRLYFKHIDKSAFHKFSSDSVSVHRTLSMFITSPHLSLVNQMTKRLVEAGIVEKIVESFIDPSGWTRGVRMTEHSLYDYMSLSIFHMLSPFIYLSVGLGLSCIALIGEIIVFKLSACLHKF